MKQGVRGFHALLILLPLLAFSQEGPSRPQRIILNMTESPATSIALTWRMPGEAPKAFVEYAAATPGLEYLKTMARIPAEAQIIDVPLQPAKHHFSAIIRDLQPQTSYLYRVGKDSCWSEWNQFRTADTSRQAFSFTWFGDPQDDILEYISRLFRQSTRTAPAAGFWLFSGDLTSEPEDDQLGEFFEAAGFVLRTLPSAMVPGNHDRAFKIENNAIVLDKKGKKMRLEQVSPLWNAHFTLPENGVKGLEESCYTFDYQGARFIMLNSNTRLGEQAAWMEPLLAQNPNRWTIVSFHHPLYSSGRDRDDRETRNAFLALFDRYHVDLVLTGHDHTYARSHKLYNGAIAGTSTPGTVYVVSASGPKFYEYTSLYDNLMAKSGVNRQLFQVVTVDPQRLSCRAYTGDGQLYDEFILAK